MRCTSCAILLAILFVPAQASDPVGRVHGSGMFGTTRGENPNHQPVIDKITVNATLNNDDGTATGSIGWMSTYNGFQPGGPGTSGWSWHIRVESWFMWDGVVYLQGTVTHSTFREEEVGFSTTVSFIDGGSGSPDYINFYEIQGNIRIEGP